jgi:nucleotide-binding universal stress UspA family protein
MKPIVAFIDFSEATSLVMAQAGAFARALHSPLILVHGIPRQPEMVDLGLVSPVVMRSASDQEWSAQRAELEALSDVLSAKGITVTTELIPDLSVNRMIAVLWGVGAGLAILGAHPHSVWYELFVGSTTHGVLENAPCPVLVVPAKAATSEQSALKALAN